MYAVIKSGGKQYRVAPGEKLRVEQFPADVGAEVNLSEVLLVGEGSNVRLGQPMLAGVSVRATVLAHGRGEKVHATAAIRTRSALESRLTAAKPSTQERLSFANAVPRCIPASMSAWAKTTRSLRGSPVRSYSR